MIKCLFKTPLLFLGLLISTGAVLGQTDSTTYGSIKFDLNVDEVLLIHNNKFDEARIIKNGETISVTTGRTSIKLSILQDYLFEEQFVLKEDSLVIVSHEFDLKPISKEFLQHNYAARYYLNSNILLISDDESALFLDDEQIGFGYTFTNTEIGSQLFRAEIKNQDGSLFDAKQSSFRNSDRSFLIVENYVKPDQKKARWLSIVPGASQHYKNQEIKGLLIRTGIALVVASTVTFELAYRKDKSEFDDIRQAYNESNNSNEATALGDDLDRVNSKIESKTKLRNLSLLTGLSIYGYNVLDAFFSKPKLGYREKKPIEFYLDTIGFNQLGGTLSINL